MKAPITNFKLSKYPNGSMTQWFAESPDLYKSMDMRGHNGIDIVAPHGTPMYAVEDGTILDVKNDPGGYGRHVRFLSTKKDRGGYYHEWTYGHCDIIGVEVGQEVKEGEQIATMGNTGFVVSGATPYWQYNPYAGTHLHLGIRLMNRVARGGWKYPNSKIGISVLNYENGYKGSVDPYPYIAELTEKETYYRTQQLTLVALLTKLKSLIK